MTVFEQILKDGLIVIVRSVASDKILDLANCLYKADIHFMEVTFDQKSTDGNKNTLSAIEKLAAEMKSEFHVGAGTVMTAEQVIAAKNAGAEYIISPNVCKEVIEETKKQGLISIPGALTPTEAAEAHALGADFVKIFPVSGPDYFRAITQPLSHIKMLAVGGIHPEVIPAYKKAGACGFGVGGNLVNHSWINEGRFDDITNEAGRYRAAMEKE